MLARRILILVCSFALLLGVTPSAIASPNFYPPKHDLATFAFSSEVSVLDADPIQSVSPIWCSATVGGDPDPLALTITVTVTSSCLVPVERLAAGPAHLFNEYSVTIGTVDERACIFTNFCTNAGVIPCDADCQEGWGVDGRHHFRPGYWVQKAGYVNVSAVSYRGESPKCGPDDGEGLTLPPDNRIPPDVQMLLRNVEVQCYTVNNGQ